MLKTFILSVAVLGSFVISGTAFAAQPKVYCDVSDHPIYDETNTYAVGCLTTAQLQKAAAESYARQNPGTNLVVSSGTVLQRNDGFVDFCPVWFEKFSCVAPKADWKVIQMSKDALKKFYPGLN